MTKLRVIATSMGFAVVICGKRTYYSSDGCSVCGVVCLNCTQEEKYCKERVRGGYASWGLEIISLGVECMGRDTRSCPFVARPHE